jgi:uncharacterized protein (DUF2384 family)
VLPLTKGARQLSQPSSDTTTSSTQSAPAAYWRKRPKRNPLPGDQAARQGDITRLAFQVLGKDEAIAFLNTDHPVLGGRPLAVATESVPGQRRVEAELANLASR